MTKVFAAVTALAFAAVTAQAVAFLPPGPATLQFDAVTQTTPFHVVSSKTNETSTATNVMTSYSATVTSVPFVSSNLLALLANSFNTNFPSGSQIGISFGDLVIVDSTGTNVILDPSAVLTATFNEEVYFDKQTQIATQNQNGSSLSGNSSETVTSDVTIKYDDTGVSPADGTNSVFQLRGLLVEKFSRNLKTNFEKVNYQFQGSGGGSVHGVQTILNGTIKANAAGVAPLI